VFSAFDPLDIAITDSGRRWQAAVPLPMAGYERDTDWSGVVIIGRPVV
jgi:hypothetical protein